MPGRKARLTGSRTYANPGIVEGTKGPVLQELELGTRPSVSLDGDTALSLMKPRHVQAALVLREGRGADQTDGFFPGVR